MKNIPRSTKKAASEPQMRYKLLDDTALGCEPYNR